MASVQNTLGLPSAKGSILVALDVSTWTPKVCDRMALWATLRGFGLLFYILLGAQVWSATIPKGSFVMPI